MKKKVAYKVRAENPKLGLVYQISPLPMPMVSLSLQESLPHASTNTFGPYLMISNERGGRHRRRRNMKVTEQKDQEL